MKEGMKEWMKECLKEIIKEEFGMDGIIKEIHEERKVPEKLPDFLPEPVVFMPKETHLKIETNGKRRNFWSKEEDDFLLMLADKYKVLDSAYKRNKEIIYNYYSRFGKKRTKKGIIMRAYVLHKLDGKPMRYNLYQRFDKEEICFIQESLGMKSKELIEQFYSRFGREKRNYKSILDKITYLRRMNPNNSEEHNQNNRRREWTKTEEETILKERKMGNNWNNIARLIHRTNKAVKVRWYKLTNKSPQTVQVAPETSMPKNFRYMG